MTEEDERRWKAYKADPDDITSRNALLERYMPIVRYHAERICASRKEIELEDATQDGIFGLLDAIEGYDLARGVKFETYCVRRVRGAMHGRWTSSEWPSSTSNA